jgi:hypothetical protein
MESYVLFRVSFITFSEARSHATVLQEYSNSWVMWELHSRKLALSVL